MTQLPPAQPLDATAADALRSRVIAGLSWKVGSQITLQISRVVVAIMLARLLTPHEYGLAGMALVFSSFVLVFSDLGLGGALVQRRSLTEQDRSTVFWTTVAAGFVFTGVGLALSGPIARFYGEPEVEALFSVLSLSFAIGGIGTAQRSLLARAMDFRSLEISLTLATLAGAAVGITLAATGFGPWSIIGQQLATAAVWTSLLWISSTWRPRRVFSIASLQRVAWFSGSMFGTRFLFDLNTNADNLLVGRFLGSTPLGAYALAYNVTLLPARRLAGPVQEVLFPAFSRMQDDFARMGSVWLRVNRLVAAASFPALLGLIVVAPDFVPLVLGNRWDAATPVIQILAWVGLLESVQRLNWIALQALDRAGTVFRYSLAAFAVNLLAFVIGLRWGIVGVAACYAVSSTLLLPIYTHLTARILGLSVWTFARDLGGVMQAAALMAVLMLGARSLLLQLGAPIGLRLAVVVAAGGAVFLAAIAWRSPEVLAEIRSIVRRPAPTPRTEGHRSADEALQDLRR